MKRYFWKIEKKETTNMGCVWSNVKNIVGARRGFPYTGKDVEGMGKKF